MSYELWIDGPLPGLNELLAAARSRRGKGSAYSQLKRAWGDTVAALARAKLGRLGELRIKGPVTVQFTWREKSKRRDIDNIAGGGQKLVLDGLVKAGVLAGDGWAEVARLEHQFQVDKKNPGVLVRIEAYVAS